jgi:hypothetical protein
MIKELLKAHCTIENGRWVFKQVDINAASIELEQVLQQASCTTLREGLEEMLNNEKKNFGEHYRINDEVREKQANLNAIAHVIKLIDDCPPVA